MGEWIQCPGCALRHSARADGLCPRCHQAVAAFAAPAVAAAALTPAPAEAQGAPGAFDAAPAAFAAPAPAAPAPVPAPAFEPMAASGAADASPGEPLPVGARVAGVLFVVLGLSNLLLFAVQGGHDAKLVGSSLVDVVLGAALALGTARAGVKGFAIFRVAAGGLVFGIIAWKNAGPGAAVFQAALTAGFLLLLVGRPERNRLAAGAIVASVMVVLNGIGVLGTAVNDNPLAEWFASANGVGEPVEEIRGSKIHWALTLPPDHWRPRPEEATAKENAAIDRMLLWPAKDAAIVVVAEEVPGATAIDVDVLASAVLENARKGAKKFQLLGSEPLPTTLGAGRLIHAAGVLEGQEVEALYGVYVDGNVAIQVMGMASSRTFAEVQSEMRDILSSLRRWDGET